MTLEQNSSRTYAGAISEHNPDGNVTEAAPTVKYKETTQDSISREGSLEMSRQSGDTKVYVYYFKSIGWLTFIAFCASLISFAFFSVFPSKFNIYLWLLYL